MENTYCLQFHPEVYHSVTLQLYLSSEPTLERIALLLHFSEWQDYNLLINANDLVTYLYAAYHLTAC